MIIDPLMEWICRSAAQAVFTNVFDRRFDTSVMSELYPRKLHREYRLYNTEAIYVPESELTALVSEVTPMLAPYTSPETGEVDKGLYRLTGSQASPRLPSVEDYAKLLVLGAALVGPGRAGSLFTSWVEGRPIRIQLCALLKGARTEGKLRPPLEQFTYPVGLTVYPPHRFTGLPLR